MFVSYMYMHERSHKASNQQNMNNSSIVSRSVLYKRLWNISERISELCQNTHIQTIHSVTLNQSLLTNRIKLNTHLTHKPNQRQRQNKQLLVSSMNTAEQTTPQHDHTQ